MGTKRVVLTTAIYEADLYGTEEVLIVNDISQSRLQIADQIVAYEEGLLDFEEICMLFQSLINSGQAWKLQGSYGRMAVRLIADGLVYLPDDCAEPFSADAFSMTF